jgi:hypothetical protein
MKERKIIQWLMFAELVRWYYHNTDMSLSQIARHYRISFPKANMMLCRKYPKSIKAYLEANPGLEEKINGKEPADVGS